MEPDEVLLIAINRRGPGGQPSRYELSAVKPADNEQPTAMRALPGNGTMAENPSAEQVSFRPSAASDELSVHVRPTVPGGWDKLINLLPECTKTELFDEEYWDTNDQTLVNKGWWYCERDGEVKLTHVDEAYRLTSQVDGEALLVRDDKSALIKSRITDPAMIESTLKDLLGDKVQPLKVFASFTTRRYTFGSGEYIIDAVGGLPNGHIDIVLRLCSHPGLDGMTPSLGTPVSINLRNSKVKAFMDCRKDTVSQHHLGAMPTRLAEIWEAARASQVEAIANMPEPDMDASSEAIEEDDAKSSVSTSLFDLCDSKPEKWLLRVTGRDDVFFDTKEDAVAAVPTDDGPVRAQVVHLVHEKRAGAVNLVVACLDQFDEDKGHLWAKIALRWRQGAVTIGKFNVVVDTGAAPELCVWAPYAQLKFGNVPGVAVGQARTADGAVEDTVILPQMEFSIYNGQSATAWRVCKRPQTRRNLAANVLFGLPLIQKFIFTINRTNSAKFEQVDPCGQLAA